MNTIKLNPIGAAIEAASNTNQPTGAGADWGAGRPLTADTLTAAWFAGESDALGLASVAADDTARHDVEMCRKFAQLLRRRMAADGREVNQASEDDGAGAGVAAVVAWRNGVTASPVVTGARVSEAVAVVAWRAVVASMSADDLGAAVELSAVSDKWIVGDLSGDVEPLAVAVLGALVETRSDKAQRLARARGAARRKVQLAAHLDLFKAGANSRRRELVDKIGRACALLCDGQDIDTAAAAVGFNASGQTSAGDRLARAVRALGVRFQLNLRQRGAEFAAPSKLAARV